MPSSGTGGAGCAGHRTLVQARLGVAWFPLRRPTSVCPCSRSAGGVGKLLGPLPMHPAAEDNYGYDACAILCLPCVPNILVIATESGVLYHCVVLEGEEEDDQTVSWAPGVGVGSCGGRRPGWGEGREQAGSVSQHGDAASLAGPSRGVASSDKHREPGSPQVGSLEPDLHFRETRSCSVLWSPLVGR